jgi:hypothetical protein
VKLRRHLSLKSLGPTMRGERPRRWSGLCSLRTRPRERERERERGLLRHADLFRYTSVASIPNPALRISSITDDMQNVPPFWRVRARDPNEPDIVAGARRHRFICGILMCMLAVGCIIAALMASA